MKLGHIPLTLGLLGLLTANTPAPAGTANAEQALRDHETESCVWLLAKDWKKSETLFAEEFLNVSPTGDVTDAKNLAVYKYDWTACHIETDAVRIVGDMGVAVGRMTLESSYFSGTFRFTDTFVHRGGRWQLFSSHQSEIKAAVVLETGDVEPPAK
jgi:hypothetical protein